MIVLEIMAWADEDDWIPVPGNLYSTERRLDACLTMWKKLTVG